GLVPAGDIHKPVVLVAWTFGVERQPRRRHPHLHRSQAERGRLPETARGGMNQRIPCLVVGCRRTAPRERYPDCTEIICGKCFRLASRVIRRRLSRIQRLMRRHGITDWEHTAPGSWERKLVVLEYQCWNRIKKQATEARMGIG